jgi:SnoaL-like polyketide cyclase
VSENILNVWVLTAAGIQLGTLWIMKLSILPMLNALPYNRYVDTCHRIDMHIFHPIAVWNGVLAAVVGVVLAVLAPDRKMEPATNGRCVGGEALPLARRPPGSDLRRHRRRRRVRRSHVGRLNAPRDERPPTADRRIIMTANGDAVVQRNKDLVRMVTEMGFNRGDLAGIEKYFAADYQVHAPGVPPLPPGPRAFEQAVRLFRTAFPDIHVSIQDLFGEEDKVFGRFVTRGTHLGPLMGIPPTSRPVTIYEMVCHRIIGGKAVESWIGDNIPRILLSIGAVAPVPGVRLPAVPGQAPALADAGPRRDERRDEQGEP